mgnify:CR=1 FL=1
MFTLSLLIISSWISLSAQTGDTVTCYNNQELRRIAERVVRARECDSLLVLSEIQIVNLKDQIGNLKQILHYKDDIVAAKDSVISNQQFIIDYKDDEIEQLDSQLFWHKLGCGVLGVALLLTLLLGGS